MVELVSNTTDKPEFRTSSTDIADGIKDGDAVDDIYSQANPAWPGYQVSSKGYVSYGEDTRVQSPCSSVISGKNGTDIGQ